MKETAANAGKNERASLQKYTGSVNRTKLQPESEIDPINGLMLQRMCRGCRSSQEDLQADLAGMPFPARRSAAMSLQKSLGNRFVQGLAVQAKSKSNRSGMPDQLKSGIESISGMDLSDVQAQGRVKPTMQLKDGVPANDDEGLEHEADVMGAKALTPAAQLKNVPEEEELLQGKFATHVMPTQFQTTSAPGENRTGMPDPLKVGLEQLSGLDLSSVRVNYNSAKPAQFNALAYTQGQDIEVGPGQEHHLPHEGWHVVQQMEGRVQPTMQMKDGVAVNDDQGLEQEPILMGAKALQMTSSDQMATSSTSLQRRKRAASPFPVFHELMHVVQQKGGAVIQRTTLEEVIAECKDDIDTLETFASWIQDRAGDELLDQQFLLNQMSIQEVMESLRMYSRRRKEEAALNAITIEDIINSGGKMSGISDKEVQQMLLTSPQIGQIIAEKVAKGANLKGQIVALDDEAFAERYYQEILSDNQHLGQTADKQHLMKLIKSSKIDRVNGFQARSDGRIYLRSTLMEIRVVIHESIHKYSGEIFKDVLGHVMNEGATDYISMLVSAQVGAEIAPEYYTGEKKLLMDFLRVLDISDEQLFAAYFNDIGLVQIQDKIINKIGEVACVNFRKAKKSSAAVQIFNEGQKTMAVARSKGKVQQKTGDDDVLQHMSADAQQVGENKTGLPDRLKARSEELSGLDLSSVRVHHNSAKSAKLNALAYTQGQDIYVGPDQKKHVPHEGWHAVQQMQGRVKQTMQTRSVAINDDHSLEHGADVMCAKATQMRRSEKRAFEIPIHLQQITHSGPQARQSEYDQQIANVGTNGMAIQRQPVVQMMPDDDLFIAIEKKNLEGLKKAFVDGANKDAVDYAGQPAVVACARNNWAEGMAVILSKKPNVNQLNGNNEAALMWAAIHRNEAIVNLLLENGADVAIPSSLLSDVALESTAAIVEKLYLKAQKAGREISDKELPRLTSKLYGRESLMKPNFLFELALAFREDVMSKATIALADSADALAMSMLGYATGVYSGLATRLGQMKPNADASEHPAYNLVLKDIGKNVAEVTDELAISKKNSLKWVGHVLALEGSAEDVSLSGWQPLQALFFKCFGLRTLLTTKAQELEKDQQIFMINELGQCLFAFQRAAEINVMQHLLKPLGLHEAVMVDLSQYYAQIADQAGSFRFPSGTQFHATYLSGKKEQEQFAVAHHNLGKGVDTHHQRHGNLIGNVGHYYPHVVNGVQKGDLASIFQLMVMRLIGEGGNDAFSAFNTEKMLGELYTLLEEKGEVVREEQKFTDKFRPLMQQFANNCTFENLGSSTDMTGVEALGMQNYRQFMGQLKTWEEELSVKAASKHAEKATMTELTTRRKYIPQYRIAALTGNAVVMATLLREHPEAKDDKFNEGKNPLIIAASLGYQAVCQQLVQAHVMLDQMDDNGWTALHWAANKSSLEICRLLIQGGASTDIRDNNGKMAVERAPANQLGIVGVLTAKKPTCKVNWKFFGNYKVAFYVMADVNGELIGQLTSLNGKFPIIAESDGFYCIIVFLDGSAYFGYVRKDADGLING
jgi:ankyrin repeat protein